VIATFFSQPTTQEDAMMNTSTDGNSAAGGRALDPLIEFFDVVVGDVIEGVAERSPPAVAGRPALSGSIADIGLLSVAQLIEIARLSGRLFLSSTSGAGVVVFSEGNANGAQAGKLEGISAVCRMLEWRDGTFSLQLEPVPAGRPLAISTSALLLEALRRVDDRQRLLAVLPPRTTVFEVDRRALRENIDELPAPALTAVGSFDGERSLDDVLWRLESDELDVVPAVELLYLLGVIRERKAHR
jgi:hypothetical protein